MHFCSVCKNMYYIRLSGQDDNSLIYYCRKCGHEDDAIGVALDNICVSKTSVKKEEENFRHLVNEYTKLDPTLPRVKNIPCPNDACPSNREAGKMGEKELEVSEPNVIYLRYDDSNMRFIYICSVCDTIWKSAQNK